jgi:peptide/nickel transport system ATP-binding protein
VLSEAESQSLHRHGASHAAKLEKWVWAQRAFIPAVLIVVGTVVLPLILPYSTTLPSGAPLEPPNTSHWLGTDEIGRDVLARCLVGMRSSWIGALLVVASGVVIGMVVGAVAGSFGGIVDGVLMRVTDVFLALPGTILAIAVVAALGPGYGHTLIALCLVWWPLYARIVRGEVRRLRFSPHVEAARLGGTGRFRLIGRHLLPGAFPPTLIAATVDVGAVVLSLAGLSFLGLGAPEPAPELGAMSQRGMTYLGTAWWVPIMPAIGVALLALVANFTGDAARDRLKDR